MSNVVLETSVGRSNTLGCWTGWVADMQLVKGVRHKTMPETFLENYPRHRAICLNTWLSRFGIYTNGSFLELDRHGSVLVKDLIKRSQSGTGFFIRVDGIRKDGKILVKSVRELPRESPFSEPEFARIAKQKLRGEFGRMGI